MYSVVRNREALLLKLLSASPAVLLVGARQTGKSSLAEKVAATRASIFFDLERKDHLKKLADPGSELRKHKDKLVVIDEVQHIPDLFKEIRTIIDEMRARGSANGKFLLLGSGTERLLGQSESLTGRIMELQLHPFNLLEIQAAGGPDALLPGLPRPAVPGISREERTLALLWERGGYPESILAGDDEQSLLWRQGYLANAIRKDVLSSRTRMPEEKFLALLQLIADKQGSITPKQEFARQLGFRKNDSVDAMLATLEHMMLIHRLPPYARNIKQQVRKSSKYYICDSGIHQHLINRSLADLQGEDAARRRGASWEGFVIQNIISILPRGWRAFYLGFARGREIDLILEKPGGAIWAIEIRSGPARISEHLHKIVADLRPERSFLIHTGGSRHHDSSGISIVSLPDIMNELRAHDPDLHERQPEPDLRQASPQYQEVITALGRGDRLLNVRRDSFIAGFVKQARQSCDQAAGPSDRAARNLWVQNRNELLEWLKLESRTEPEGRKARQWQQLLCGALEEIAGQAHQPRRGLYDFYVNFPRLCCHDLFVHGTAVLMDNGCHEFVHTLTERRYLVGGSMLAFICFWSGAPEDLAGIERLSEEDQRQTVAEFVASQPYVPRTSLLQAELLLFVSGMLLCQQLSADARQARKAAAGYFCWDPWLFRSADTDPPLPFFRHTENREGMENFLSCLGLAPSAAEVGQLKKTIDKYLEKRLHYLTASRDDFKAAFLNCINIENWHDNFPSQVRGDNRN